MTSILSNYSNLTQRLVAAILGAIVIIGGIYYSEWTYFAIFFVICMLTQLEFYKLVGLDGMIPLKSYGTATGLFVYTISFLIEKELIAAKYYLLVFPILACIFLIKLYKKAEDKPFTNIAFTFLGIMYIAGPFALLNIVTFSKGGYSYQILLGCLLILWASDTGAYFAGVKFGKRKLFERVSPKKSWEGSLGGGILALAMAYCLSEFFQDLDQLKWMGVGIIIIVAGTYGDLVESLFKRSISIKDSGSIIPGHGGFLDRFDGLLLAVPFIACFLKLL